MDLPTCMALDQHVTFSNGFTPPYSLCQYRDKSMPDHFRAKRRECSGTGIASSG
jgi:hypothetical protein